jgi:hypothetical protein
MAMLSTFDVSIVEYSGATSFYLYDDTDWTPDGGFVSTNLSALSVSIDLNGSTYSKDYTVGGGGSYDYDTTAAFSYDNLFGIGRNAYWKVYPSDLLLNGTGSALADTYFPDGYYSITIGLTYDGTSTVDNVAKGFVAHASCKASQLPLMFDMNNYDYEERRLTFLIATLLNSAEYAAELGRQVQFETIIGRINDFYSANDISNCW